MPQKIGIGLGLARIHACGAKQTMMHTQKITWYKSLNFKGMLLIFLVVTGLVIGIFAMMNVKGRTLVLDESSRLIEQIGNNMVSDLTTRTDETAALTRTMGRAAELLPKSEQTFNEVFPTFIDFQGDTDIYGGGVWPEPYAFDSELKRRSFYWARSPQGGLIYDDYFNTSEAGYHHEEWYVVVRHLEPRRCAWSRVYIYDSQPMVTVTAATYNQYGRFSGTVTIDLTLEGLQAFADNWQKKTGGYVFITDQHNTFITFPDPSLARRISTDDAGNQTEEFLTAAEFAQQEPLFFPIADILDEMNRTVIEKARQMPGYRPEIVEQIDLDSYQISQSEAELIAAIVADPLVKRTFYKKIEIDNDFFNKEKSFVYTFYVPQSYWKVVIVKPFSEATAVTSNLFQWLVRYLAVTVIIIMVLGYLLLNWLLLQPLARITDSVKTISQLMTEQKLHDLKHVEIAYPGSDELGILATYVNSLVNDLENSYQEMTKTQEQLQQQIEEHRDIEEALEDENSQLKLALSGRTKALEGEGIESPDPEEFQKKDEIIRKQQNALKQCTTPVIQIWEDILLVPYIGTLESDESSRLVSRISQAIEKERAEYVILNITDIPVLDVEEAANQLLKMVQAVTLVGGACLVVGIPADVAGMLVNTGVDVRHIITFSRIEQALRYAISKKHDPLTTKLKEGEAT